MGCKCFSFFLGLLLFSLVESSVAGQTRWTNIVQSRYGETKYEIIAPQGYELQAKLANQILQTDVRRLMDLMEYAPRDQVFIVIEGALQSSNGMATTFPTNTIYLYDYPPMGQGQLSYSAHWWRILVVHEFMHIIQMDQTSDFQEVLRQIFGSVGKWSGVSPRWFAEGVAVWAESLITGEGRLRDPVLRAQYFDLLKNKALCSNVDCLDDPGIFPFLSHAYWGGGYFIEYLEKIKPGAVKCLLKVNSATLPFFLNNAFQKCLGSEASTLYSSFLNYHGIHLFGPSVNETKKKLLWQAHSGLGVVNQGLMALYRLAEDEQLIWEPREGDKRQIWPKGNVDYLQGWPQKNIILIYQGYSQGEGEGHDLAIWDGVKQKYLELGSARDPWYFPDDQGKWWSLRYQSPHFYLVSYNEQSLDKVISSVGEVANIFPALWNIRRAHWLSDGKLVLSFATQEMAGEQLAHWDIGKHRPLQTLKVSESLQAFGQCDSELWWASGDSLYRYSSELGHFQQANRPADWLNFYGTSHVSYAATHLNPWPQRLKAADGPCLGPTTAPLIWSTVKSGPEREVEPISDSAHEIKDENSYLGENWRPRFYPSFKHFRPYYWIPRLQLGTSTEDFVGAQTSIGDPKGYALLGLSGQYHLGPEEWGYDLSPQLHFGDWYAMGSYQREVVEFAGDDWSINHNSSLASFYKFYIGRGFFTPGLEASQDVQQDFLGRRREERQGGFFSFGYRAQNSALRFQSTQNQLSFFKQSVDSFGQQSEYGGGVIQSLWDFHLYNFFNATLSGQYGRLAKGSFGNGVLMGGGPGQQSGGKALIEFLPLQYGNLYGNRFWAGEIEFDYEYERWYRGPDLFPLFWKSGHFFGGYQTIQTDYAYLENRWQYNRTLGAVFAGLRTHATLFYRIPLIFDLGYASVLNKGVHQAQLLFLVKSGN